ncbi:hypothetical protein LOK49_LG01G01708 [Camellia lanceoleosa]|uniref:Uncharacterized protein n=1 Tax=Camellia lanceoleosa TaxID=1840588 RepID=A0ACC0IXD9_9ERIC|nr:hypothetical protein LOK49_LG01G01708 [Camellia lanceoleosa]
MIGLDGGKLQTSPSLEHLESLGSDVDNELKYSGKLISSSNEEYKLPAQLVQRYVKDFKQSKDLKKTDGTKRQRITGITKLEDANDLGRKSSDKLIAHGINVGDVKKLQDVGIYTCNGLMMHTKKVH